MTSDAAGQAFSAAPAAPAAMPEVTLAALFLGFLKIALRGFGGVLAWSRKLLVEERRWLSERDYTDMLSLCQFLPGPNVVNVSIYVGARFRGPVGSLAAFAGLILVPFLIVIALGALYGRFADVAQVRHALGGVSAAAAGLVVAMGLKMARPHLKRPMALVFLALAFAGVGVMGWPLLAVVLPLAPFSIAAGWLRRP